MKNKLGAFAIIVCFIGLIASWSIGNTTNMIFNGLLIIINLIVFNM